MAKLILATNNQNKVREIREMLADTQIEVLSQRDAGIEIEVEENGSTFAENAALKAQAIYRLARERGEACCVLADDSGLAVDALNGAPGVHSHRWAGGDATDADRIAKLLDVLRDTPDGQRGAHFACTMCLITPDGTQHLFEGRVEGEILHAPCGENGFGYDPVFGYGGRSFAQISAEEKNAVSHRADALRQVTVFLQQHAEALT